MVEDRPISLAHLLIAVPALAGVVEDVRIVGVPAVVVVAVESSLCGVGVDHDVRCAPGGLDASVRRATVGTVDLGASGYRTDVVVPSSVSLRDLEPEGGELCCDCRLSATEVCGS